MSRFTVDSLANFDDEQEVLNPNQPILYADNGYLSHQVRLVLIEKHIDFNWQNPRLDDMSAEDIALLNPYNTLPIFVHRELILYRNEVIFEYLEDRYHQHKLLPDNPVARANYRQLIWRISHDWVQLAHVLLMHSDTLELKQAELARKNLSESLVTLSPLFAHKPFFLSDTLGLCDCILASILWRLDEMQIQLPRALTRPLLGYMARLFERVNFQKSIVGY